MKIGPNMMGPGAIDTQQFVDQVMEAERAVVTQKEGRRERVLAEKNEYSNLSDMLGGLGGLAGGMKSAQEFTALKFESSHPEIFDGVVSGAADVGRYEIEVDQLASPDRFLDTGFADPDTAELGFGFMAIEKADGTSHELTIEPGSNLRQVADQINDSGMGVKAMIVNTGAAENPFRLMVSSADTGEKANIRIDPDTTFLEMDHLRQAGDMKLKFEDVEVKRPDNAFRDLLNGVEMTAKKAAPGTKVSVEIKHDADKTFASISDFVGKYNTLASHINGRFQALAQNGGQQPQDGVRADSNMRSIMRSLQSEVAGSRGQRQISSLADIGITTNAKTGELTVDEQKLKKALSTDYSAVRDIFVSGEHGAGLAERIEGVVKRFKDPQSGAISNRMKSLDQNIRNQDKEIERQNERLAEREAQLKSRLATMQDKISQMNSQGAVISARLGGGDGVQQ
jgi:flagellar hook-associated protein 2